MIKDKHITIIGAGLVGSLLSIYLAKAGFTVDLLEKRLDFRKHKISSGRSINLALASRGLAALEKVGLVKELQELLIPMKGRQLHLDNNTELFQLYGLREHEVIYSISREELNKLLLNTAEQTKKVTIKFNINIDDPSYINDLSGSVIAADGFSSVGRKYLKQNVHSFKGQENPLGHSYKELVIPAISKGDFAINKNALHIWPRNDFMLIALPNLDGSFTATLFLANSGENSFESLADTSKLQKFFDKHFPDTKQLIPNLVNDFFINPTGKLATVKSNIWHYKNKLLLIGDAAHAIVPFHGQGMNCGFEDCAVFADYLANNKFIINEKLFKDYTAARKDNCDAIADMAIENYVEMRDLSKKPNFQKRKEIAFKLEQKYPEKFIPRYSMVMFHNIPYKDAFVRGREQDVILDSILSGERSIEDAL